MANDPEFQYRENLEIRRAVAILLTRASFVKEYLRVSTPNEGYQKTPIYMWPGDIKDLRMHAMTYPEYNLTDEELQRKPEAIDSLKIRAMHIVTNKNGLGKRIEIIEDVATQGILDSRWSKEFAEEWRKKAIEEESTVLERAMVEEVAHAFFWLNEAGKPGGLHSYLKDREKYFRPPHDAADYNPTEEEVQSYIKSPIEQDGEIWKAAFTQRYYPELAEEEKKSKK